MALALGFGLIALVLMLSSSWNDSPSYDEPEHITAGYVYWMTGRSYMNPFHPPLVKDLAGLAVWLGIHPPVPPSWDRFHPQKTSQELFSGSPDVQSLIRVARILSLLLSSGFVVFYYLALSRSQGATAAFWATWMLTFCPPFLGHGPLVHTDVPAAAAAFATLWLLARYREQPNRPRFWLLTLSLALACLVKFSMLLLLPYTLITMVSPSGEGDGRGRATEVSPSGEGGLRALACGAVVFCLIWLVYLLHPVPRQYQEYYNQSQLGWRKDLFSRGLQEAGRISYVRHLAWYGVGLYGQGRRLQQGHIFPAYLAGQQYWGGRWTFFPTVVLTKVPLGLWFLAALGLFGWIINRQSRQGLPELRLMAGFALLYAVVAMTSNLNLGIRHVLPLFPLFFAWVGQGMASALNATNSRLYRGLLALGAGLSLGAVVRAWPYYLSYFNELSQANRGVDRSFAQFGAISLDSDYDWGTGLYRLQQRAHSENWRPMYCLYHGKVPPEAYLGERYRKWSEPLPSSGFLAMSLTYYIPFRSWLDRPLPAGASPQDRARWEWGSRLQEVDRLEPSFVILKLP